jgi:putative component of membrane protein insertase Oxa1/YidC/SpoIIIJ protein YidD
MGRWVILPILPHCRSVMWFLRVFSNRYTPFHHSSDTGSSRPIIYLPILLFGHTLTLVPPFRYFPPCSHYLLLILTQCPRALHVLDSTHRAQRRANTWLAKFPNKGKEEEEERARPRLMAVSIEFEVRVPTLTCPENGFVTTCCEYYIILLCRYAPIWRDFHV